MDQCKQNLTTSYLLPSETCDKDRKLQRQIYFFKATT